MQRSPAKDIAYTLGSVSPPVGVDFLTSANIDDWHSRYKLGLIDRAWPYGIDELPSRGVDVNARTTPQGLRALVTARVGRRIARSPERTTMAWDEITATRHFVAYGQSPSLTGAIWLTDWALLAGVSAKAELVRRMLRGTDCVWTLSEAQAELVRQYLGPRTPVVPIRFGIDSETFSYEEFPQGSMLVLSVGNDKDRNPVEVLRVARAVRRVLPAARFVIQTANAGFGSEEGISVVPRLSAAEMSDLYKRCSVVLICTRPNTHVSGMTVALEAMSVGRPVVMSNTIGASEYVESGRTGVLFESQSTAAAASAVVSLLKDTAQSEEMGLAGRAAVERSFTTSHLADGLANLIHSQVPRVSMACIDSSPGRRGMQA